MRKSKRQCWIHAVTALVLLSSLFGQPAEQKPSTAGDELNQGVSVYKAGRYEEAIDHFRRAAELEPTLMAARLYLATAYAQQYVPGADTPENREFASNAIAEYKLVLVSNPTDIHSLKGIAYLDLMQRNYDEAVAYYQRAADVDPSDPENYYGVAYIDWTVAYRFRQDLRNEAGLQPTDSAIDKPLCATVREHNWGRVTRGIEMLKKAIQLRADYDDAMAYLNLMYRERADMQCGYSAASEADLKLADDWVDKTIEVKKAKAEHGKDLPATESEEKNCTSHRLQYPYVASLSLAARGWSWCRNPA
jgi:tetratricopeptide (TPR) repeat protein